LGGGKQALEPLSLRERGRGEGLETVRRLMLANPHPALRATFSRREKEQHGIA
jgi:hypothetical protein